MRIAKSLSLTGVVLAIVALLGATNAFAQLQCTSKIVIKNVEYPGTNTVTVNPVTENGRTTYTYAVSGTNATKFFVYVKKGLGADLVSTRNGDPLQPGNYLTPHIDAGGFPPLDAWRVNHHQDGVEFNNIAIGNTFVLSVPERYKPEEGVTTVLLGDGSTYQHCGPILGPMTMGVPSDPGDPIVSKTMSMELDARCTLLLTAADKTNKKVTKVELDTAKSNTANCEVSLVDPGTCESELGVSFCPRLELGDSPLTYDLPESSGASIAAVTCTPNTGASPAAKVCGKGQQYPTAYQVTYCDYPMKNSAGAYLKLSNGLWRCS